MERRTERRTERKGSLDLHGQRQSERDGVRERGRFREIEREHAPVCPIGDLYRRTVHGVDG